MNGLLERRAAEGLETVAGFPRAHPGWDGVPFRGMGAVPAFDLQRFAEDDGEERTEAPTPRRREEARRKGQVARTAELGTALVLLAGAWALRRGVSHIGAFAGDLMAQGLGGQLLPVEFTIQGVTALFQHVAWHTAVVLFPVGLAAATAGLLSQLVQVGFLFTGETLTPRLERINPIAGMKRIVSRRALVELGKALAKLAVVGSVAYGALRGSTAMFPRLLESSPLGAAAWVGGTVWRMAATTAAALLLIAILDYGYQRSEHERSLRMTRRQLKEELRQTEGDPLVRRRIRERQRRIASQRMMQQVPTADVVITNPTHVAVALRYDAATMEAPVVVAKGAGHVARRIREVAMEHGVVVVEDVWLARTLYQSADIGDPIPENLYRAVARVLAFAYRVGRRRPARA